MSVEEASRTVAPHAGAWIETGKLLDALNQIDVAPHAGAWIETCCWPWLFPSR